MKKTRQTQKAVYIDRSSRKRRKRRKTGRPAFMVAMVLVIALAGTSIFLVLNAIAQGEGSVSKSSAGSGSSPQKSVADATPTPEPSPAPESWQNPILFQDRFTNIHSMGSIVEKARPSLLGFSSQIYKGAQILQSFNRENMIKLYDPLNYSDIPGVTTFRGNNFRNAASFGYADMQEKKLEQIWERSMGGLPSSSWSFSWSGTGWTGQPVMVMWPKEIREMMNINSDKKQKQDLIEVITAAMDGYIYFYDLEDGKATRPAIRAGVAFKGTPAIDPRGYPMLYVGQGDYPPKKPGGEMGIRIYNLIDQSLLYFHNTARDTRANRPSWGALDSSPIIDKNTDTLFFPCENGMMYTAKLNTVFDKNQAKITINPEFTDYKYKSNVTKSQGIESSMAIYGGYGYFGDNSGAINCIDLNTLKPVWAKSLANDNDVTPVLRQSGDNLYLYSGTQVDDQKSVKGSYQGDAFVYKMDALTGEIVWRNSYKAWTYTDPANPGYDINGGIMGSLITGKGFDLVIASVCMTNGFMRGNTVVAFDDKTGDLVWEYKMNHYTWSSPVDVYDSQGNMYILIADSVSQIHLIDGSNGERLDVIQIKRNYLSEEGTHGGNIESSPAVFGDILVIGTRGGLLAGVRLR